MKSAFKPSAINLVLSLGRAAAGKKNWNKNCQSLNCDEASGLA